MFHQAMESAGKKFIGEHDFRNFCKMDAANVHNYRRHVTSFAVTACDMRLDIDFLFKSLFTLFLLKLACSSFSCFETWYLSVL